MNRPGPSACRAVLLAMALALPACDRHDPTPVVPGAKPGRLIGKLADARGNPLSDVTVSISGFTESGEPVTREVVVRGPATSYELELPDGKYGTPVARVNVDYNERRYVLPLASADDTREWVEQRDSRTGLVRDWVWRISGRVPGGDPQAPSGYWGGALTLDKQGDLGDPVNLQITLKPDGPLIDGTQGQPLVFERTMPWKKGDEHFLLDVPIGRYVVGVRQVFGSKSQPLRVTCFNFDPARPDPDLMGRPMPSALVEFECVEARAGEYRLLVPSLTAYAPR